MPHLCLALETTKRCWSLAGLWITRTHMKEPCGKAPPGISRRCPFVVQGLLGPGKGVCKVLSLSKSKDFSVVVHYFFRPFWTTGSYLLKIKFELKWCVLQNFGKTGMDITSVSTLCAPLAWGREGVQVPTVHLLFLV